MAVNCGNCQHFQPLYANGQGPGFCNDAVVASSYLFWSDDMRYCPQFASKDNGL